MYIGYFYGEYEDLFKMISSIYNDSSGFGLFKLPQASSLGVKSPNSIYDVGFGSNFPTNFMTSPFDMQFSPFCGDFSMYMNNDFASTMLLFDALMARQLPPRWSPALFNKSYNTTLPTMKSMRYVRPESYYKNKSELKDVYNPDLATKLANIAEKNANEMRYDKDKDKYLCSRGVRLSLEKAGISNGFRADSAYQGADLLRQNKNFKEVAVEKDDLTKLPAGCVIVWEPYFDQKGDYHRHGHIATTLGDGQEASDRVNPIRLRNTDYSVFVPSGVQTKG